MGAVKDRWTPKQAGHGFEFSPILKPLEPLPRSGRGHDEHEPADRGDALEQRGVVSLGRRAQADRGRRRAARSDARPGDRRSHRQGNAVRLARAGAGGRHRLRRRLRHRLLVRLPEHDGMAVATVPVPMETNPRVVFERLFGRPGTPAQRAARAGRTPASWIRCAKTPPICKRGLGARDQVRLNEYLENIREIERRIQIAEKERAGASRCPTRRSAFPTRSRSTSACCSSCWRWPTWPTPPASAPT